MIDYHPTPDPMRILLVFALLLPLVACEQADPAPADNVLPAQVEATFSGIDFARDAAEMPQEVRMAALRASIKAVVDITKKAGDRQEADAMAQAAIENAASDLELSKIEQATAKLLLVSYLAPNAEDAGAAERALAYADVLVQHESPETEAVLTAARTFADEWPQDDLRRIALRSAETAEEYAAGTESCVDCDVPDAAREHMVETGQTADVKSARRLSAAEQLRALAK